MLPFMHWIVLIYCTYFNFNSNLRTVTHQHVNSHHLLAQVCAILEERVADQGGVDGKLDLGVEPLDHGLGRDGKVVEEGVPLRQEMRSDGGLEIGRVENEAP